MTRRILICVLAVFAVSAVPAVAKFPPAPRVNPLAPHAHIALVTEEDNDNWTWQAWTPSCNVRIQIGALCYGYAAFYNMALKPAWSQMQVCGVEQDPGTFFWNRIKDTCGWYPNSPAFRALTVGTSAYFFIKKCNHWYSTEMFGKVLLEGGWVKDDEVAPGVMTRC